ncbi:predicted transcriptional regulator [Hahella chejuensis KCTC 2396]|uniref:Predicted transcriptional regulator n=1 Tax=Hahella chejuensis (strain KCTC 2396) TaxID=349521 RepID=Q2SC85_HAHCH|nr:helix-turn-helix transcriptional regulator [Hahella chejuensis]ABC31739.1 predicted transcriptional regulator [Hahella chejuensis KCTC 2396]
MSAFGAKLRELREARRLSQLELSLEAEVSARHISFMETGRSKPSREMVLHMGRILGVDMATTNSLLTLAGYSQVFGERRLDAASMAPVRKALEQLMCSHMPYPAIVLDRHYNLIQANAAQLFLMQRLMAAGMAISETPNFMKVFLARDGLRSFVDDWELLACHMLQRVWREHTLEAGSAEDEAFVEELLSIEGIPSDWKRRNLESLDSLVINVNINLDGVKLRMFSSISSFGAPLDITVRDIRIEHFFLLDDATEAYWRTHCEGL